MDNSDEQKLLKQTFKFVGLENAYQELVSTQEAKIDILKGYMTNEELKKELIESLTEKLHLDSAKKRKLKLALSNIEKIKWESNIEEMAIDNFNDGRRREMKLPQLEEFKLKEKKIFCSICQRNVELDSEIYECADIVLALKDHTRTQGHDKKLKYITSLAALMQNDITWFFIKEDNKTSEQPGHRIYCYICKDLKGRRVTTTIASFTILHCDITHKEAFREWKVSNPNHPFQKPKKSLNDSCK